MDKNDTKNIRHRDSPLSERLAAITAFLKEQKAGDVEIFRLEGGFTDALLVAGATSRRHAQGMASGISRLCAEKAYEYLGMEGYDNAQWILVDCNDLIINILQKDARDLYRLEELWAHSSRETGAAEGSSDELNTDKENARKEV